MSDNNQPIPPTDIPTGQPSRQPSFEDQRSRGGCLTTILVLLTIAELYSIPSIVKHITHPITPLDRSIFPFVSLILIAADLIAFYGIWTWKKWGVKLLVTAFISNILINIVTELTFHNYDALFQGPFLTMIIILIALVLAIVILIIRSFYLEVKKRWQYFS